MNKHRDLAATFQALTGKTAPSGTSTMALQVLVNQAKAAAKKAAK